MATAAQAHLALGAGQGLGQIVPLGEGLEQGQEVTGTNGFPEAVGVIAAAFLHVASLHVLGHDVLLAGSPAGRASAQMGTETSPTPRPHHSWRNPGLLLNL